MVAIANGSAAQPAAESQSNTQQKKVSLQILSDITTAQSAHGLKHADYLRYRKYCSQRLSRTRSATNTSNAHPSNPTRYIPTLVTPSHVYANPRALTVPLIQAERAWAYAMDVKRTQPAGPCRARRQVLSKLSRAVHFADLLSSLSRECADHHTILEAEAYTKTMQAVLALEREAWQPALRAYEVVEKIYTGMAGVRAGTPAATLYEQRLEQVAQAIRFCKYNLSRDPHQEDVLHDLRADATTSDMLTEKIEAALVEARKRAAVSFGEVTWCGIQVPLRAERVREAVLTASQESKAFNNQNGVDAYDRLFMVYNDAIKVVSDELAQFRNSTTASEDRTKELEHLVAYLSYDKLQHTIARNLLLVESSKSKRTSKPDDFVRLYDNLIGNMTDILALPGVDEDAAVSNDAESRRQLFRAHRCFHLAQCYQVARLQSEAAALFDRVNHHTSTLTGKHADEAANIVRQSTGMKCRARAEAFLSEHELEGMMNALSVSGKDSAYVRRHIMLEHLEEYESYAPSTSGTRTICEMPPALEAVPCKPVFFDLAVDGVHFPEYLASKKKEEAGENEKESAASGFAATRFGKWWSGTG